MMKPELDNLLKERFFALYWGQMIMFYQGESEDLYRVDDLECTNLDEWALLLRSIDQLTDEENIEIAKIFNQHIIKKHYESDDLKAYLIMKGQEYALRVDHFLTVADYMRSIGIAIGFMGYSVEELITAGWIKLKKDN